MARSPSRTESENCSERLRAARSVDIRLLHHRHQRLLRTAARLQKRRQIAARPQPRDLKVDLAKVRVSPPIAIPVALGSAP